MGRPSTSRKNSTRLSSASLLSQSQTSIDADSVVKNERVYLHINDYETREYTGLTTYHGMVRIYNSTTWPSRIFWCVVVVSCLSLFMIHSGIMLYSYHLKPTLTQVTVVIPKGGLEFPEVTICGFSPIIESKVKNWNMSTKTLIYLLDSYGIEPADKDVVSYQKEYDDYVTNYSNQNKNWSFNIFEFFENVGPRCEDLVKVCYWSGLLVKNCCKLTESKMTDYGRCITFPNVNGKRRQKFSGYDHGLEIILDPNAGIAEDIDLDPFVGIGARVYLHQANETPQFKRGGITIPPGMRLYTGINVQKVTLLPKNNWGHCQPDWDDKIHNHRHLDLQYSAAHCELNCKINSMLANCGCVPVGLATQKNDSICGSVATQSCIKKYLMTSTTTNCNCSVECEKTEYLTHVSYSNMRFTQKEREMMNIQNLEEAKSKYVGISLYMREITYEHHEQQRQVQTADLLSNIAGSMGLFLGMSTITLLEIFIYLFKSIWGTVNTERQKNFVKSVIQQDEEENNVVILNDSNTEPLGEEDNDSLVNSDTEDTFKDPEIGFGFPQLFDRRKSTTALIRPPTVVLEGGDDKRASISSQDRRLSYGHLPGLLERRRNNNRRQSTQQSRPQHQMTLDIPGASGGTRRVSAHRLSVAAPGQDGRRPSSTELFRQARRPSQNFLNPTALSARRASGVPAQKEIHLQILRRPSAVGGGGGVRRPSAVGGGLPQFQVPAQSLNSRRASTYNNSLL